MHLCGSRLNAQKIKQFEGTSQNFFFSRHFFRTSRANRGRKSTPSSQRVRHDFTGSDRPNERFSQVVNSELTTSRVLMNAPLYLSISKYVGILRQHFCKL